MSRKPEKKRKIGKYLKIKSNIQARIMYFRYAKEQLVALFGILLSVSGALDLLSDRQTNYKFHLFLLLSAIIIALYCFYYLIIRYKSEAQNIVILPRYNFDIKSKLKCGEKERIDGYRIKQFKHNNTVDYYIESDRINDALKNGAVLKYYENKRRYSIPVEIKAYVPAVLNKVSQKNKLFFNGKLLRQASHLGFIGENELAPITVQKTDYFSGQCTHEIVYHSFVNTRSINDRFNGSVLLMNDNDEIFDLNESLCADFMGASTIVVTKDDKIIIGQQGSVSMANANCYVPSGSGSVNYRDFVIQKKKQGDNLFLNRVITYSMEREFFEECGIKPNYNRINSKLVGYVRLLERGGKPDYFGVSYIDMTFDEIIEKSVLKEKEIDAAPRALPIINNDISLTLKTFFSQIQADKKFSIQLYLLSKMTEGVDYQCLKPSRTFEVTRELSRPGGKTNEDLIWHSDRCLVLLDGATGLNKNCGSADRFVKEFIDIFSDSLIQTDDLLSAINKAVDQLNESPKKHPEISETFPSAAGAFAFIRGNELQILTVGDCDVILQHKDKRITKIHATDLEVLDKTVIDRMKEIRKQTGKNISDIVRQAEIRELLLNNRKMMNTPGGYRTLSYNTAHFFQSDILRFDPEDIERIVMYSDGFKEMSDRMTEFNCDLKKLFTSLRKKEANDASLNNTPRFKISDDASALIAVIR